MSLMAPAMVSDMQCPCVSQWRRQYGAFSKTLPGQIFQIAVLVWFFRSGLFFKLLNFIFILFWIVPLVLVPLGRKYSKQVRRQPVFFALCKTFATSGRPMVLDQAVFTSHGFET